MSSQEIPDSRSCAPRTRRVYSAQFKAELIAACQQPGASIAATAREHGMNANVLHRWLKEHRQGLHQSACDTAHAVACGIAPHCDDAAAEPMVNPQPVCAPAHQAHPVLANPVPAFVAMTLGSPVMGTGVTFEPWPRWHSSGTARVNGGVSRVVLMGQKMPVAYSGISRFRHASGSCAGFKAFRNWKAPLAAPRSQRCA